MLLKCIFRIYFQLITWFKSKYGIGFLYTAYRYCTYFFALGIHCCERISLSWSLFICYIYRYVITVDDWVTWTYRDRHHYDPINGIIVSSKSYIDWILSYLGKIRLLLYWWLIKLLFNQKLLKISILEWNRYRWLGYGLLQLWKNLHLGCPCFITLINIKTDIVIGLIRLLIKSY